MDKIYGAIVKMGYPVHVAEKFSTYAQMLLTENERTNLTRITEPVDVAYNHFVDAVSPVDLGFIHDGDKIMDVGTGPGIPAIPLAIMLPHSKITAIESVGKKVDFVDKVVDSLCVNVDVLNERAEKAAFFQNMRSSFDVVVSRAVASLPVLLELVGAFAKEGGIVVAYKGKGYREEAEQARNAAKMMGLRGPEIYDVKLGDGVVHYLLKYEKLYPTGKKFPRRYSVIKRTPL